ncbi:MAG: hypothetical protein B6D53_00755 [Candidatus Omnitrophica bacterium 4484_49]|nr:MAG: hypothetical protein B6D53_00755 [Candidatus Omnitrophica bacterium 4484_49]RLE27427.1 MAG: translation elongation factor-like protein [Candidatus Acetothermia bacterium]HDM08504.1 translation elongation factor-like protein [Candidatus Omnitrophota bacterium]
MDENWVEVGIITNYYAKPMAAVVEITAQGIKVGEKIKIKGHTTDFEMVVESMQIEHQSIQEALPGQIVGLKVKERVRPHDRVYKLVE